MLFGIAHKTVDKRINVDFIGVEEGVKEPCPIYEVKIGKEKLYLTLFGFGKHPMMFISSDLELVIKEIEKAEMEVEI